MKKENKITVNKDTCKGCMLCVGVCPHGVLEVSEDINKRGVQYVIVKYPEKCTGCGLCWIMCPDCGIEIKKDEE